MARDPSPHAAADTDLAALPATHWTLVRCAPGGAAHPADQVLVGPSGIYVIVRRPAGLDVDVRAARAAGERVGRLLPERYRDRVVPVLCLVDDDPVALWDGDVLVTGGSTLEHVVRSSPVRLSTCEVRGLGPSLTARLEQDPAGPTAPSRRRAPLTLLAGVAASAAVVLAPWADDAWLLLQRGIGLLG